MFDFLALITKKRYWVLHTFIIKVILKLYGVKVGKGFYIEGTPKLKLRGKPENVIIRDNVSILGNIDIRNRENGKIIFENNIKIENDCRFVAAREGKIFIGENSVIGAFSILNGGGDIIVGRHCLISTRVNINANEHKFERKNKIRNQGFLHSSVTIGDDCLIGAGATINKGVRIREGSVIGGNSVVTKDTEEYSINVGSPATKIRERI